VLGGVEQHEAVLDRDALKVELRRVLRRVLVVILKALRGGV
jgi:hypothetical protein